MAVTLTNTGITFSDSTSMSTAASSTGTLSSLQYTAYQSGTFSGYQTQPTSDTFDAGNYIGLYPGFSRGDNGRLIVGVTYYRTSATYLGNDGRATDAGTVYWRTVYRTIAGL